MNECAKKIAVAGCQKVARIGRSGPAVVLPGGARPTDQDDSAPPGTSDNGFWNSCPSGRECPTTESRRCWSEAVFAEGVGLEPTSPFGQRFSSYAHDVLTLPAWPDSTCLSRSSNGPVS